MKRIYTIPMIFLAVLTGGPVLHAQDAGELVKRVHAKLNTVRDYQASAILRTDVPFLKIPESPVTVFYKHPDKFRIKKEEGLSIIPRSGISMNLNALFTGEHYTAVAAGTALLSGRPVTVIKLIPLDNNGSVVLSTLYIDTAQALIRKAEITTRDNGTYEIEMQYNRYRQWGLPDKVLLHFNTKDYKLPKGVALEYDAGNKPPPTNPSQSGEQGEVVITYSSYSINKGLADSVFEK